MDEKTNVKLLHMLYKFCCNCDNCDWCPNHDECKELTGNSGNILLTDFLRELEGEQNVFK